MSWLIFTQCQKSETGIYSTKWASKAIEMTRDLPSRALVLLVLNALTLLRSMPKFVALAFLPAALLAGAYTHPEFRERIPPRSKVEC